MEKETNNLQRDAKNYLDAMRGEHQSFRSSRKPPIGSYQGERGADLEVAMASSQTRIADTIGLFYSADRASDVSVFGVSLAHTSLVQV